MGRPNAGKSTLVNRLIGEDRLLVGPEAGITRDAIPVDWTYDERPIRLVDTAGLRRRARVQETLEKLSTADTIRAITFAEVVILVMDADNAFETQDLQIADLVEREGRGLVFCLAKWDLVESPQERLAELRETAERMLPQVRGTPLVFLSAETGRGVDRLMPAVFATYKNWSARVKTKDLNDWLSMATQRHPPPAVNGRRIKPKYMAQMKGRPPTFVLMASRAEQLPEQYKSLSGQQPARELRPAWACRSASSSSRTRTPMPTRRRATGRSRTPRIYPTKRKITPMTPIRRAKSPSPSVR